MQRSEFGEMKEMYMYTNKYVSSMLNRESQSLSAKRRLSTSLCPNARILTARPARSLCPNARILTARPARTVPPQSNFELRTLQLLRTFTFYFHTNKN